MSARVPAPWTAHLSRPRDIAASDTDVIVRPGDPRLRLFRHIVGERLHDVPELIWRTVARNDWEDRPSPVPQRERAVRTGDTKVSAVRVNAGPNTPKLIRLRQHPFALDTARPVRDDSKGLPARIKVGDQVREPFGRAMALALQDARRDPFPNATSVHPPLPRRDRPSADAWLKEQA